MGWLFSMALLFAGLITNEPTLLITSGLFAIAGSIAIASHTVKQK